MFTAYECKQAIANHERSLEWLKNRPNGCRPEDIRREEWLIQFFTDRLAEAEARETSRLAAV